MKMYDLVCANEQGGDPAARYAQLQTRLHCVDNIAFAFYISALASRNHESTPRPLVWAIFDRVTGRWTVCDPASHIENHMTLASGLRLA